MWVINVHAWVEVVGSVMELFHLRVQWNARNVSRATLRECGDESSCQEANLMYEETDDSLSEGERTWPCSIQKYCRVQRNREFVPVQWGRWGRLTMKRCGRGGPGRLYGRGAKVPYIGPERGKLREVNPVSAINTDEEKSGKRCAEACGNFVPLPHSPRILSGTSRVPGHWEAKSSAVPGHHTAGWANEPRGWTPLLLSIGNLLPVWISMWTMTGWLITVESRGCKKSKANLASYIKSFRRFGVYGHPKYDQLS